MLLEVLVIEMWSRMFVVAFLIMLILKNQVYK